MTPAKPRYYLLEISGNSATGHHADASISLLDRHRNHVELTGWYVNSKQPYRLRRQAAERECARLNNLDKTKP